MALRLLPPAIRAAALAAGVTRLADVSGLDMLGVPVWQAVRPWSRTVSVSQGKGLSPEIARIAAAMEAIEADAAERIPPAVRHAAWFALEPEWRFGAPDDFARVRGGVRAYQPLDWFLAERLDGLRPAYVPRAAVLLDFTVPNPEPDCIEIGSNGQGAHCTLAAATLKGLLEVIERDATAAAFLPDPNFWRFGSVVVEPGDWPWFDAVADRAQAAGIALWLYAFAALAGATVVCCEMREPAAFPAPRALARGIAAASDVGAALRGAVTEAAQVRLTNIAFAREDLTGQMVGRRIERMPPFAASASPRRLSPGDTRRFASPEAELAALTAALRDAGYPDILRVRLETGVPDVHAVRVLVPGLGSATRARRAPL